MVEHCYVVAGGRTSDDQLGIHDDALVAGHARLCERVRSKDVTREGLFSKLTIKNDPPSYGVLKTIRVK